MGTYGEIKTRNPLLGEGAFVKLRTIVDKWLPSFRDEIAKSESQSLVKAINRGTGRPSVNLALLKR